MVARLPEPGGDKSIWGDLLNEFLLVGHEPTGELKLPDVSGQYVHEGAQTINPAAAVYGAKGDAIRLVGVTSTSASPVVTAPDASFTSADIGKQAVVCADFSKGTLATIAAVHSSTQVSLSTNAGITLSDDGYLIYGTDDTASIQAAINNAATGKGSDNGIGPNSPAGTGFARVELPVTSGKNGGYIITGALTVPAGVLLDSQSLLFNFLPDRYAPCIVFGPYSRAGVIRVDAIQGTGIQCGSAVGVHADIHADQIMIWHAGFSTEVSGSLRRQDAIRLLGYGFLFDTIWIKGGVTAVYHDAGSDCSVNRLHCIGSRTGVQFKASNQVWYGTILLDTIGLNSGGTNGINIDSQCSNIDINVQAFTVIGTTSVMDNVVAIGTKFGGVNRLITVRMQAALTGGAGLYLSNVQDISYNVSASNNTAPSFGGSAMTTAVVYGTNVTGYTSGEARLTGTITPYSGTVPGPLTYYRTGVKYSVQGGSAPGIIRLPANGTGSPTPSISAGNDARGRVSFGSGTGTSTGSQVQVTFAISSAYVSTPFVVISPMSSATAALQPYVTSVTTNGFNIGFAIAPPDSQANGTYTLSYRIES